MATTVYEKIFAYCERGQDPAFWAEPLNAVTNAAFLIAGVLALYSIGRGAPAERSLYAWTLALLALLIGVGSFLFHTVAERWAGAMDVIPITIFMLLAVYALGRKLMGWPIWGAWGGVAAFLGLSFLLSRAPCPFGFLCASKGYLTALAALGLGGWALSRAPREDQATAGRTLLIAAGVFLASLTLRSLDRPFCETFTVSGYAFGSHFWWHLLNAVVLYLVIRAFSEQQRDRAKQSD